MIKKLFQQRFFKDSFWSIAALVLLNVVLQFLLYPFLNRKLGTEEYGNTLYLLSIINIISISVGVSVNNRRMVASAKQKTSNAEYNIFLIVVSVLLLPVCAVLSVALHLFTDAGAVFLFWLLMCATMWRYYSDVEFRLNLNYKGYFVYYLCISIGYLIGIALFQITNIWMLLLLPGELLGLCLVLAKGSIFKNTKLSHRDLKIFLQAVLYLIASQLLIQIVFNSDRFVLKLFCGGVAVTLYYVASLMGKTIALLSTPLNSVIIGYLAKSKKEMTTKMWFAITGLCLGIGVVMLIACVIASHIVICALYPDEYSQASSLFVLANFAQIIYFLTGVLATILLRYVEEKYQLYITIAYVAAFVCIVIPCTWKYQLFGFACAQLIVNIFRFIFVFLVMLKQIKKQHKCIE